MRSKTLRSMTVTVLSSDGSALPTQVTVTVPIKGVNNDLIRALSTACSLRDDETLLVAMTFLNSITHFLDRLDESLDVVLDSRVLVAYRLLKNEDSWPMVVFIHNSGEYLERFGIPMVARIHPDHCNGVEMRPKFLELVNPFHVGEASSCVNERFEFFMTIDRFTLEVSDTVMDNELLVVPSSGEICVFAAWPDEMLKQYDTEILSHSPPNDELPDNVVSLYQCLERLLRETTESKKSLEQSIDGNDTDLELNEWWYLQSVKHQKHILIRGDCRFMSIYVFVVGFCQMLRCRLFRLDCFESEF
ncbi:ubiquitin carboxyl-terminal hydrolase 8-like isoform X2 [Rutidosis leptorrhynchoides]